MCAARRSVGVGRRVFDVGDVTAVGLEVVEEVGSARRFSCDGKGWRVGGPSFKMFSSFVVVVVVVVDDVVVVFGDMLVPVAVAIAVLLLSSSYIGLRFCMIVKQG